MSPSLVGPDCTVHPTAVIGDLVQLGARVTVGPYAVLTGSTLVEDDCWIGAHTVIGTPPEIAGFPHFDDYSLGAGQYGVRIGARTTIRELTTVHAGSERTTIVGSDSFIMNRVSIEHDCQLGDGSVAAPGVAIAGHVTIGPGSNLGVNTSVHQRRVIGPGAMVGMGTVVTKDIPPFSTVVGNPVGLHGANSFGMRRKGFGVADIEIVAEAYASGTVPDLAGLTPSTASAFTWWLELATKPLVTTGTLS